MIERGRSSATSAWCARVFAESLDVIQQRIDRRDLIALIFLEYPKQKRRIDRFGPWEIAGRQAAKNFLGGIRGFVQLRAADWMSRRAGSGDDRLPALVHQRQQ